MRERAPHPPIPGSEGATDGHPRTRQERTRDALQPAAARRCEADGSPARNHGAASLVSLIRMALNDREPAGIALSNGLGQPIQDDSAMPLQDLIKADLPFLRSLRQDLHAHPELGFEEERTSGIVASLLEEAGLRVHRGLGKTGVVGTLQVGNGTRTIGLRADMDALAMPEQAERPYKSKIPGKMHACGHDGHTTLLLGAARHLANTRNFSGTVHFIFQPAEEGRGGAKKMVEDGLFGLFPCDAVYGLHNMPGLATDEMAVTAGPQLASSDTWFVTFKGVGTHGAKPHLGKDPITASGHFLSALQTIVGRVVNPLQPAVVSACSVQAGDPRALNVIPDVVEIGGTARAYSAEVRDQLEAEIGRLAKGVAAMFDIEVSYEFRRRIPPVINHPDATASALKAARSV